MTVLVIGSLTDCKSCCSLLDEILPQSPLQSAYPRYSGEPARDLVEKISFSLSHLTARSVSLVGCICNINLIKTSNLFMENLNFGKTL